MLAARGDEVLIRTARGMASIELGVPLSPDYAFRIGSISKQFSAAALLRLVDSGRARLDDPLSKTLPDFPGGSTLTLAQLLNHTSGVKSYTGIPGYMDNPIRRDLSTAELTAEFKSLPPDFAPNQGWAYSNSGYVLVGAVIEAITGKPWHAAVAEMTQPLGLVHTRYGDNRAIVPGMAEGYSRDLAGQRSRAGLISMSQPHAAGALVSKLDDLWRWNRALHGGRVLQAETYRRMTTPEGAAAKDAQYGYGLFVGTLRGEPMLQHGGGIHGFSTMLLYLPQSQLSVAVLRNSDAEGPDPNMLARQIAALALGKPYPDGTAVTLSEAELQRYSGRYRKAGANDERLLRVQGGVLRSLRVGGQGAALKPVGGGVFLLEGTISRIEFGSAPGVPAELRFFPEGEDPGEVWQRMADAPAEAAGLALTPAQVQPLLGEYSDGKFDFRVFIDSQGQLRGQALRQQALLLHAKSPRLLYVNEVDAQFAFEPAAGPAARVVLTQGRVRLVLERKSPP